MVLTEARSRLNREVLVTVIVNIARSVGEAETQLKTGIAVNGEITDDEPEAAEAEVEAVEGEATKAEAAEGDESAS